MKRDNSYLIGNQFAKGAKPNRTAFKLGQKPWNIGLKGWCPKGSEKGHFKKGQRGNNFVPIGTVRIRIDKKGKKRRWIKVTDTGRFQGQWKIYATWLWEREKGAIPNGLLVHHLDGDSLNDAISNYALVTRAAHIEIHRKELYASRCLNAEHPGKGYVITRQCKETSRLKLALNRPNVTSSFT